MENESEEYKKPEIKGEESQLDERKRRVDERLSEMGISRQIEVQAVREESQVIKSRDLVSLIRESRKRDKEYLFPKRTETFVVENYPNYRVIEQEVKEIAKMNEQIEDQVKTEILGLSNNLVGKVIYGLQKFYHQKILNEPSKPAETILYDQTSKVNRLIGHLNVCREKMEKRVSHLDSYYDDVAANVLSKYSKARQLQKDSKEKAELLLEIESLLSQKLDENEIIQRISERKRLRSGLQQDAYDYQRLEKAVKMLKKEIPVIGNLSDIGRAYANSLREIEEGASMMSEHLQHVTSIYLDIMRTQKINARIFNEMKKLFVYTDNMTDSLQRGLVSIKAPDTSYILDRESATLDNILERIESEEDNPFKSIETRLGGYLTGGNDGK